MKDLCVQIPRFRGSTDECRKGKGSIMSFINLFIRAEMGSSEVLNNNEILRVENNTSKSY